jgi:hypothetical protein
MNLDTVRKCAMIAADARQAALGVVDDDIMALIAELDAPPAPSPAPAPEPAPVDPAA